MVNGILKAGASTKCVPAREQSQQGALQAKLGFLQVRSRRSQLFTLPMAHHRLNQSPTSTTTYKRDGKLHKFVIELDFDLYTQFVDPTLQHRLYGQVFSGAARTNYPGFEQVADPRPGSPGTQYVYTLFSANREDRSRCCLIFSYTFCSTSNASGKPPYLLARPVDAGAA